MMDPNDKQVGGNHYREIPGEQHWDRVWRKYGRGYFVGQITKYVERYDQKNGRQDLEKAAHFLDKLISLEYGVKPDIQVHPNVNRDPDLGVMEILEPLYPDPMPASVPLMVRGYYGTDLIHFECKRCKTEIKAKSWREAEAMHGDCAGRGYVNQS